MKIYNRFAVLLKNVYRFFHQGYRLVGFTPPEKSCVYIVHHQNLSGPVHAVGLLPGEARLWVHYACLKRAVCFEQFYGYTFTKRFHWPKVFAWPTAWLLSLVIPPVLNAFGAIPVHRSTGVFSTMRQSLMALENGESLIICPDVEYSSASAKVGDVYTGYLGLEKLYFRQCGQHIHFVPLFVSRSKKALVAGTHVVFRQTADFKHESARVSATLRTQINMLAALYGDITPPQPVYTPGEEGAYILKI